ncbi:hypothetical protein ACJMK2_036280 [Sinanodonta woodiana]|uniref:Uncharacterized protein n=1 Tax=Sinanodonta woodiana TaxID=1069815 RepID=A0ABD3WGQ7_SINWO
MECELNCTDKLLYQGGVGLELYRHITVSGWSGNRTVQTNYCIRMEWELNYRQTTVSGWSGIRTVQTNYCTRVECKLNSKENLLYQGEVGIELSSQIIVSG